MKFYFCEACGVRVTEEDIDDGLARNKKLKGVYCSQCAVGVTTMDSLPLTDEQATDLVRSEKSSAPKRRSTSQGVVQPRRPRTSSRGSISLPKENRSAVKLVVVIGSVAALIVLGLIVLIPSRQPKDAGKSRKATRAKASSAGKSASPPPKESTSEEDGSVIKKQVVAVVDKDPDSEATKLPAAPQPPEPRPTPETPPETVEQPSRTTTSDNAEGWEDLLAERKLQGWQVTRGKWTFVNELLQGIPGRGMARIETKAHYKDFDLEATVLVEKTRYAEVQIRDYGRSYPIGHTPGKWVKVKVTARGPNVSVTVDGKEMQPDTQDNRKLSGGIALYVKTGGRIKVKELRVQRTNDAAPVKNIVTKGDERQNATATESNRKKPTEIPETNAKFARALLAFEEAVKARKWSLASSIASDANKDPALISVKPKTEMLVAVAGVFAAIESERQKAIEKLLDGKPRIIQTKRRRVTALIKRIDDKGLDLTIEGKINGKPITYGRRIPYAELTEKGYSDLFGAFTPATPPEWLAQSLRELIKGDLDTADTSLTKAGATHLTQAFKGRCKTLRAERREVEAENAWPTLQKLEAGKKWKPLLEAIAHFQATYASTAVAERHKLVLQQMLKRGERALLFAEGIGFDFSSPLSVSRFKQIFSEQVKNHELNLSFDNGKLEVHSRGSEWDSWVFRFWAPQIAVGANWDLSYKIETGSKELGRDSVRYMVGLHMLFSSPEKNWRISPPRLSFWIGAKGRREGKCSLTLGFDEKGLRGSFGPKSSFFKDIKGTRTKCDRDASWEGVTTVRISMRGPYVKADINGSPALDAVLPPDVVDMISKSCLGFDFKSSGTPGKASIRDLVFNPHGKKGR